MNSSGESWMRLRDAISVPDIIALLAALGGVAIVVGSLIMLYKGILTLQAVSQAAKEGDGGSALDIQIGKIQVKSQYPTLGLFILGIGCFFGALWFAKENVPVEYDVQGRVVDNGKYIFTFTGFIGVAHPDVKGDFHRVVPKGIDEVHVQVGSSGKPPDLVVLSTSKAKNGVINFGDYPTPTPPSASPKAAVPMPTVDPAQVTPTTANLVLLSR